MEPKIQALDGIEVVNKIKENIDILLRKKVTAVKVSRQFLMSVWLHNLCRVGQKRRTVF